MRQFTVDMRLMEHLFPPTKVIVCGTRTFSKRKLLYRTMHRLTFWWENVEVVSGGAEGADALGYQWATENWYKVTQFFPNWKKGKKAGPLRNEQMAQYVGSKGFCIAFWDGRSPGTKSMIQLARDYEVKVKIVRY